MISNQIIQTSIDELKAITTVSYTHLRARQIHQR